MVDLSVTLSGVKLDNPIIPASGTFGFGQEFAQFYDLDILGSISFKGTTAEPRFGNPTPRIAEAPAGMLNAVGLQNPGIDAVIAHELPELAKIFHKPLVANIGGFSLDEYAENVPENSDCDQVGIIEVNISCPNLHCGGQNFGNTAEGAAQVTKAVRAVTKKPIYMKLTPNVTDIAEIARACEAEGADGVSLINTLLGMRLDLKTRKPILANGTGGLSGPALLPIAVRMVYQVYRRRQHSHHRHGRRHLGPGRCGADAGRRRGRAGGRGQSAGPLRLQKDHRRPARALREPGRKQIE